MHSHGRHEYVYTRSSTHVLMGYTGSSMGFHHVAAWDGQRVRVEPLTPGLMVHT